ncbi:alanine dehydrogenase [Celerinatantimonas yamalensis]|uniref:Alanine dehydrogenase n=1 Tax=Celerinatantimonas yamalensis TaxID=559956 RepID=A0ABW9G9B5_9GAMM
MRIGVPKETKHQEDRVGLTPQSVGQLVQSGHHLLVEHDAGKASGFTDQNYQQVGALICYDVEEIFSDAQLIIKIKEPQATERAQLHSDQILFTYLHLAADRTQTEELLACGVTCIAYETVTDSQQRLPLLQPMSEIAGRLSIQAGAMSLERLHSGRGVLLSGIAGVPAAKVVIVGGGVVGSNAAMIALGMGAQVYVLDKDIHRLRQLEQHYHGRVQTAYADPHTLKQVLSDADLVIGAVLNPGAKAPKVITRELVGLMQPGAAIVDVAIDQGGCCETSVPTTHQNPTYLMDGIVHYCVTNMPAAVSRTATLALNQASLPYIQQIADLGLAALRNNPGLKDGLNIHQGRITDLRVAESLNIDYVDPLVLLT